MKERGSFLGVRIVVVLALWILGTAGCSSNDQQDQIDTFDAVRLTEMKIGGLAFIGSRDSLSMVLGVPKDTMVLSNTLYYSYERPKVVFHVSSSEYVVNSVSFTSNGTIVHLPRTDLSFETTLSDIKQVFPASYTNRVKVDNGEVKVILSSDKVDDRGVYMPVELRFKKGKLVTLEVF